MRQTLAVCAILASWPCLAERVPSADGYYEGTVDYTVEYMRDRPYMTMVLKAETDFWLTVDEEGKISGQGDAEFGLTFGVDWTMATKSGLSVAKALGVSVDPEVTLALDPTTAHQTFYVTGEVREATQEEMAEAAEGSEGETAALKMDLRASWTKPGAEDAKPPVLRINVVGTLAAGGTGTGSLGLGMGGAPGAVRETIEWTPGSPFAADYILMTLAPRTKYGPMAAEIYHQGASASAGTFLVLRCMTVQKIDFAAQRELARLRGEVQALRGEVSALNGRMESLRDMATEAWTMATINRETLRQMQAEAFWRGGQ